MRKPKVFVARLIPEEGLALLRDSCDPDIWTVDRPPSPKELLDHLQGAQGLLCLLTDLVDAALMDATHLKVISNLAVGVDNIDIPAATARGIPVGNTPGVLTDATADFAFALLLAAARRVVEADRFVRAGNWKVWGPRLFLGADLAGATLGLIGFGRIGQAVARRAEGFGLRVLFFDPSEQPVFGAIPTDLDGLLRESDIVSLHVPLTPETRHLINADSLGRMKPGAILVNTSRGAVVDPVALYSALRSGRLAAAALDVTEPEPLPADSPLLALDNCIVAPHIGSASRGTRAQMAMLAAQNLIAGVSGERLPHCVNPEVYGN